MSSDGDEYGDFDEEDMVDALDRASQHLPTLKTSRLSNRRRISTSSAEDSIEGFLDDELTGTTAKRKRGNRSRQSEDSEEVDAEVEEEERARKKKSKHKIRIPRDNELPATTVQYGTQIGENPDSSPSQIRGAIWKLPRKVPTKPTSSISKSRQPQQSAPLLQDEDDLIEDGRYQGGHTRFGLAQEFANLPSDAFSSSPFNNGQTSRDHISIAPSSLEPLPSQVRQRLVAPQNGLRQMTLFGGKAPEERSASQVNKVHSYRVDVPPEPPTHHALDLEAIKTWVYPTNLGTIRNYQYSIVKNGLFNNTLVALPTGLGKTFIAATIMLNYFRWTKDSQIVFMAPTKPLVSQQVDACFHIAGIPRSTTTLLTGSISPALRHNEWQEKRVFFMTPQTLENDLRSGIADPKKIVLLVVDEAHRATGNYAYVKVIELMRKFSQSFRILALTATPGTSVEAVQEVMDGLEISKVEIRTEQSIDIQPYVHSRKIEEILLDPSDEIVMIKDLLSKALQPLVDKLRGQFGYFNKDPMALTAYGLMQASKKWLTSDAGRRANMGLKGMIAAIVSVLSSIAHAIKLLNYHGIGPFYDKVKEFRDEVAGQGSKGSKYRKQINESPHFNTLMDRIRVWINKDDFIGHPKLTCLCDTILNHFLDAGEGRLAEGAPPSSTRVIVFSEYRDSAEDITRVLNKHGPMIRASVFVGQADSKRSEGMTQSIQNETIRKFKTGSFNVLVATSIGEEGLDIGEVDLIVCFDASASPIRMLQRMGRTGRKRAGNIVLLLMRGKEQEAFVQARDNYEKMQKMISEGTRFTFRHDLSSRILPRGVDPVVDKRDVEIPIENTQDPSMPEPTKRSAKAAKKPPKKFNMPDGVEKGFRKASKLRNDQREENDLKETPSELSQDQQAPVPPLDMVLLTAAELKDLERQYQNVYGDGFQEVSNPEMNNHPASQRILRPVKHVRHGKLTKRFVNMIQSMNKVTNLSVDTWRKTYDEQDSVSEELVLRSSPDPSPLRARPADPSPSPNFRSDDESPRPRSKSKRQPMKGKRSRKRKPASRGRSARSISIGGSDTSNASIDDVDDNLEGFVVGDGDPLHPRRSQSTQLSSSPELPPIKSTLFFEPTQFAATQETNVDEDMPDVGLLCGKPAAREMSPLGETLVDENIRPKAQRAKRQRVVVDEDSDE